MGPLTQWRGQSDTTDGRLRWLLALSLLLHAPLTPLAALLGLLGWLTVTSQPAPDLPPITAIPVDLLEGEEPGTPPPAPAPAPEPEPAAAVDPTPAKPVRPEPTVKDAGVVDAEPSDAEADAEAGVEDSDGGVSDGGIPDPVAASGDAQKIVDANANVRIKIYTDKIRNHPLGPRIGKMLRSVYQWRDFFGPAGLDPIRDLDQILIAGSQLRNSSDVVAVLKVNVSEERAHAAIDALVQADPQGGAWLDAGVATARADRAPRVFVMPSPGIIIVTPPSAAESAAKVGSRFKLPPSSGPEVLTAFLITPWQAFQNNRLPLSVPKSILWVRAKATPDARGGALIEILAEDESAEKATEDAEYLTRAGKAATEIYIPFLGSHRFVERIEFAAQGKEIHGTVSVNAQQLDEILDYAAGFLAPVERPAPRERTKAPAPSATSPAPSSSPEP